MDFEFQEWERLTSEVTDGPADLRVAVEGRAWLVRRCGETLWVRLKTEAALEHNFLVRALLEAEVGAYSAIDPRQMRHYLGLYNGALFLNRPWKVAEDLFAAWSQREGWRFFKSLADWLCNDWDEPTEVVPFRLEVADKARSSTVYQALTRDLNDANSDASYSARFIEFDELEQQLLGVQSKIEIPQQFADISRQAARAFASQWPAGVEQVTLGCSANGLQGEFRFDSQPLLGVRARTILGHIARVYELHPLADDTALPSALRTLIQNGGVRGFSLEVTRPSMHEQLEAALQLRRWLQTHWPDGVKHLDKVV